MDTIFAIVCKTYEGDKALETYDKEGCIIKSSGDHDLRVKVVGNKIAFYVNMGEFILI